MSTTIMNGNELIVQGALEAGFSLYTGYPGSPLADFFNILYQRKDEFAAKGIKVVIANSEANAAAMASGAKQAGKDTLVAMKSMGLHVASDALSVGNFANPGQVEGELSPGVVIAVGDDPWSISTSTPADSRYLFKHLHIPFLEPSTPQELKDWIAKALEISKKTSVYQGLLLTTFMAEGGGRVELFSEKKINPEKIELDTTLFDLSKNVMVPPNSMKADTAMVRERFPKVKNVLEEMDLDQIFGDINSKVGVLSSGAIFETVKQVLEDGEYLSQLSLYKLACPYPLTEKRLKPFLSNLDTLIVVEEKRGFIEGELYEFCKKNNIDLKMFGKEFVLDEVKNEGFPAFAGLSYEIIKSKFLQLEKNLGLKDFASKAYECISLDLELPRRLPTFCPGCPHRETLSLLKDLRQSLKGRGIDLVSHGDVGCYSLSFLEPFKEMHNLSAMGQGGALGAGVDIFTKNPSVVLMGDSTFFHSGITDISNSVQLGHNIIYIILDNDNTAMTGHQMSPSSGISVVGESRPKQNILTLANGLGVDEALEVNPSDRYFYQNLLHEMIEKSGVKVIVSNKECGLTFHGRRKALERKTFFAGETLETQTFYQINTLSCEDCRECIDLTGCPGLTQTIDAYGKKMAIDPQICVADSYCSKIKVCPSFEKIEVEDFSPTKYLKTNLDDEMVEEDIPLPTIIKNFDNIAAGDDFRVVVTGVGGTGVTTISRILAEAAISMDGRDDLDFKFVDQKGLAQRNGNVTGHLCIFKKGTSYGAVTPRGSADLLLSPDLLDGSAQIGFLGNNGQAILNNDFQTPLSIMLDREIEKDSLKKEKLISELEKKLSDRAFLSPLKSFCEKKLGKDVYASAMILGVAFQQGRLPFSFESLQIAFEKTLRPNDLSKNLKAFYFGRLLILKGQKYLDQLIEVGIDNRQNIYLESLKNSFLPWQNTKVIINIYEKHVDRLARYFPEIPLGHLQHYLHDLYLYDRGEEAEEFLGNAIMIKEFFEDAGERAIALRALVKTYWIKDEIFVAHLLVSPLQKEKDDLYYGKMGTSYKKTHINRPAFDLFGQKIEFDIHPKDWMLKIFRHLRLLRFLLPAWHQKEKEISLKIRTKILEKISKLPNGERRQELMALDNIKGYREVRYAKALEAKL